MLKRAEFSKIPHFITQNLNLIWILNTSNFSVAQVFHSVLALHEWSSMEFDALKENAHEDDKIGGEARNRFLALRWRCQGLPLFKEINGH